MCHQKIHLLTYNSLKYCTLFPYHVLSCPIISYHVFSRPFINYPPLILPPPDSPSSLGLERCAGDVVADILNVVETYDPDEAQMRLVMREFPTFLDYYGQLRDVEPVYASRCLSQWKLFVQGPPNRPNQDDYGLIHVSTFRALIVHTFF